MEYLFRANLILEPTSTIKRLKSAPAAQLLVAGTSSYYGFATLKIRSRNEAELGCWFNDNAESLISTAVQAASTFDASIPPKLLRLLFHDCFVDGCDASILLDSTPTETAEKEDPANSNLQGLGVITGIKRTVELACAGVVSCADIIALAARDAVVAMGGPKVEIPTGRLDGLRSSAVNVRPSLPDTPFGVEQLLEFFGRKGLDHEDLAALSGAHTVGVAHCTAFNDRFTFGGNGTVISQDPTMDPAYAAQLVQRCPASANTNTLIVNDLKTPTVFDNAYYEDVQAGHGLFHSDAVLLSDSRTAALLRSFGASQDAFFAAWAKSFTKLSLVGVKTSPSQGQVRKKCNLRN
ncbi:hypothetical protein GOP47_0016793 [Adiantum capillus-veneris]|uniref:Peroxidase n=1 Tax=Adiantum capillus-veneris TaxID=13818 RepID=A0A9D4UJ93_ADICA|nr:hypothetical protein GOP47_0016793 [Adiantum capillus-veneris]